MTKRISIAIDGPAASGKSTLSKSLAENLDYLYFDTGVMYRAVTLAALNAGINMDDKARISKLAEEVSIDVSPSSKDDGRLYDVSLNNEDCTWEIRKAEVDKNVSLVSAYPGVRAALTKQQRKIGARGGVVMAGRDIGTVVLPDAQLKIFLDASVEERARRRYEEMIARGEKPDPAEVLDAMRMRDEVDENRELAPLKAAEDAIVIRSDGRIPQDVLAEVLSLAREKIA